MATILDCSVDEVILSRQSSKLASTRDLTSKSRQMFVLANYIVNSHFNKRKEATSNEVDSGVEGNINTPTLFNN